MSIYSLDNGCIFIFYSEDKMKKNSDELSRAIIKKFGNVPDQSPIKDMLQYSFEWCADKLTAILNDQTELRFYQAIFLLHEFSCHFTSNHPKTSPVPKISIEEYALYRRTLKLCLEHACDLNLSDDKAFSFSYFDEIDTIIETILYWGGEAYFFSNLLAEEKMYKGSVHLRSEVPGKVSFQRNPYFEFFQMEMSRDTAISSVLVSDKSWFSDFATATKNCLGIEFDHIQKTICMIHDYNEQRGGQLVLCNWAVFPKILQEVFGVDYDKGVVGQRK